MLTEARVMLPGVQALLGFGLIAVLTQPFDRLPGDARLVHAVGLMLLTLTIILLIAPAAVHRLAYGGQDTRAVHRTGSALITAASLPLALGLSAGVYVAFSAITETRALSATAALVTAIVLCALWYGWPLVLRARG
jgi:hypothetical protein